MLNGYVPTSFPDIFAIDHVSNAVYVEIPSAESATLQCLVESYEGIATVRTSDPERGVVGLYFPAAREDDCRALLGSLLGTVAWRPAPAERAAEAAAKDRRSAGLGSARNLRAATDGT